MPTWLPVLGYESDYLVSDDGRVLSLEKRKEGPGRKLSKEDADFIKRRFTSKALSVRELASRFNVTIQAIYYVLKRGWTDGSYTTKQKELTQCSDAYGYKIVGLTKNGKTSSKKVHRLVACAFLPNPENKPSVNHKDGNKANNNLTNLEWVTDAENRRHAVETGLLDLRGENNGTAVLTSDQVLEIRRRRLGGEKQKDLAKEYGVSVETISEIHRRLSWTHI